MASVASTAKASGCHASVKRARRPAMTPGGRPPGRKSGPGWKAKHRPRKLSSNSSSATRAGPDAGSLMYAYLPLSPSSTTKWFDSQNTIMGNGRLNNWGRDTRKPRAASPWARAARMTAAALAPSRDTPQSTRSASRGTQRP